MADNPTFPLTGSGDATSKPRTTQFGGASGPQVQHVLLADPATGDALTPVAVNKADGATFTPGTDQVMVMGAEVDDTSPAALAEGKAGALRSTPARAIHVNQRDQAGLEVQAVAVAHGANPTAVAAAARPDLKANRAGIPFVIGGHPNSITVRANFTAAQTDTSLAGTIGAGTKVVVTRCTVTADNANTVDVGVRIGFGAANTPTTTGVVLSHPGIRPGGGVQEGNGGGILGVGADGEELRITSEVPTTGSIDVVFTYYTIES